MTLSPNVLLNPAEGLLGDLGGTRLRAIAMSNQQSIGVPAERSVKVEIRPQQVHP